MVGKEKRILVEKAKWYDERCAGKLGIELEDEPVFYGVCSNCGIKNWVRPFGHAGADVPEEGEVGESIPVKIEPKIEVTITPEVVEIEAENVTMTPEEKEIFDLKAKLAQLEEKQ